MKKLAVRLCWGAVCLGAFGLVACDGEPPIVPNCNPVQQTGCQGGEKCTFVIDSVAMEPILGTTRCVPDGTIDGTQACTSSIGGAPDDCKKGLWCSGNTCEEICSADPETCGDGQGACVHTLNIFEDNNIGLCSGSSL